MRALSNSITIIILLVLALIVAVPFLVYMQNVNLNQASVQPSISNYVYLRNLQNQQVQSGHPGLYYNPNGSILIFYSNGTFVPPSNLTIVGILYLNPQGVWQNITTYSYPIKVYTGNSLNLPSYTKGRPVIIVTSLGNVYFLTPGSAIGPYSSAGKGGLEILSQIYSTNGPISISVNATTNINGYARNYSTPVAFPNQTGTFQVSVPQYVYYQNSSGYVITGVFHNWILLGQGTVSDPRSSSVTVSLTGQPLVLIANYSQLTTKVTLTLVSNLNQPLNVSVNGRIVTFTGTTTLTVYAGFVNFTVITLQVNYTVNSTAIEHYTYTKTLFQVGANFKVYNTYTFILFSPPNSFPSVELFYTNDYNYYYVTINQNGADSSDVLLLNGTVYSYGSSYWIESGNYSFSPTGTFYQGSGSCNGQQYCTLAAYAISVNGGAKQPVPSYFVINSPVVITVYYKITEYFYPL